ncbi:major facilitator superfamily domain-containing protein [Ilyonectria sp. MPI-CAGE-AT-0026]|nr:major facilitator superfamily domain-containing protein [Ilyonectria sp. MPI-CAGE-AT-0026]
MINKAVQHTSAKLAYDAEKSPAVALESLENLRQDDISFPEGGLEAWLVVFSAFIGSLAALGITNTIAAFQLYVSTHQLSEYSEANVGWIFSVYMFLAFFCGVYIGPVFDKFGPRWLIVAGTICIGASLMLLSVCTEYWHFLLVFGICNGIGCSLLFTPCIAVVGHFFHVRRGLATGIASTGGSVGGIIFPLLLQRLFANPIHPDIRIFKEPPLFFTTIAVFLMEFALFIPLSYISSYAAAQGFDDKFSFQILTIMNAGSFFGRLLPGWWADRAGPFNSNMASVLLSIIACLVVWLPFGHTKPGIITFAILIGFASGNNIGITPVCIGKLCTIESYGRIINACGGSYWGLIVFTSLLYTLSLLFLILTKGLSTEWKLLGVF